MPLWNAALSCEKSRLHADRLCTAGNERESCPGCVHPPSPRPRQSVSSMIVNNDRRHLRLPRLLRGEASMARFQWIQNTKSNPVEAC